MASRPGLQVVEVVLFFFKVRCADYGIERSLCPRMGRAGHGFFPFWERLRRCRGESAVRSRRFWEKKKREADEELKREVVHCRPRQLGFKQDSNLMRINE